MPCKAKIKYNVETQVEELSQPGLTMSLQNAKVLATDINMMYNHHVVEFNNVNNKVARAISIPSELVDVYYDMQLKQDIITSTAPVELNKLNADLNSLNLTPDVVNYLYATSRSKSQGISLNTYNKEVQKLIGNLRVDFTNQEILEKIKCL